MLGKPVDLVASHPLLNTRVLLSAEDQLFASTDKGNSWSLSKPLGARPAVRRLTFNPSDAGMVAAASGKSGVLVSNDGGISWQASRYGLPVSDLIAVTMNDKDKNTMYAWTANGGGFRSINAGLVWDRYSPPWQTTAGFHIAFDPHVPSDVIAISGRLIYYSPTGGGTWFLIPAEPPPDLIATIHWNSTSAILHASVRDGGVYSLRLREHLTKLFTPQQ
jgi:photosystem II stability/assembly factor-like uncharacterized protein